MKQTQACWSRIWKAFLAVFVSLVMSCCTDKNMRLAITNIKPRIDKLCNTHPHAQPAYLSIYLPIHPSIYLSIHPSIYPSIPSGMFCWRIWLLCNRCFFCFVFSLWHTHLSILPFDVITVMCLYSVRGFDVLLNDDIETFTGKSVLYLNSLLP